MRFENREDPMLWINRAKNGYFDAKDSLCVTGTAPKGRIVTEISTVSMIRKGILVTLYRYAYQDGEHLLIPVNRDEARSWNVPLNYLFKDALANTSLLFPPRIYDLKAGCYIDYPYRAPAPPDRHDQESSSQPSQDPYDFESSAPTVMAAECPPPYTTNPPEESMDFCTSFPPENPDDHMPSPSGSGLRLIVSTSPIVGDAPILYPDLLFILGRTIKKDPTILICEPGKLFVFDGADRKAIEKYIESYKNRFGIASQDPRIYKYLRKNKQLLDNTSAKEETEFEPPKESNIPRGSIASAWGDIESRNKLLDWKRRYGKSGDNLS